MAASNYHVRHLQHYPRGMDFPAIVQDVRLVLSRAPLSGDRTDTELVLDQTLVGKPITAMFGNIAKPIRVTFVSTGSTAAQSDTRQWDLPIDVALQIFDAAMHGGALRFADGIEVANSLQLMRDAFKNDDREGTIVAIAIALWRASTRKAQFGGSRSHPEVRLGYQSQKTRHRR